jgi:hypothetical protein
MIDPHKRRFRWLNPMVLAVAGAACLLWLLYLFFQTGQVWDESEHAHVAWLMSQGKRPIDDFFQHHQPLLWDLLSIYDRVGLSGAEVLIWGWVIVVLCGSVSIWSLLFLGRSWSVAQRFSSGLVGIAALITLTLLLQNLFVSRPETLATACMLAALALWCRGEISGWLHPLAAGVLAGMSCYASPRFVLLGAFFLLLGSHTRRRWVLLLCGGVLFVGLYTFISGFSIEKILFDLQFSAYLQSIGDSPVGRPEEFWVLLSAAAVLPMLPLLGLLAAQDRARGGLLIAYVLTIFVLCNRIAGLFRYEQAYAPFVVATPIALTWLTAHLRTASSDRSIASVVAAALLFVLSATTLRTQFVMPQFQLLEIIRAKNALASLVPPNKTVLFFTDRHPITVMDASYYGNPLYDAQDRLCRAVRGFRGSVALPPCGYLRDMEKARPYFVDARIGRAVNIHEIRMLDQWLGEGYARLCSRSAGLPGSIREALWVDELANNH